MANRVQLVSVSRPMNPKCRNGLSERRDLFLTFDDGPHADVTPGVLGVLREYNAKASFFVVGERLVRWGCSELVAEASIEGHTIGNHSFTHRDLTTCTQRELENEMRRTAEALAKLGICSKYFRPPYGSYDNRVKKMAVQLGLRIVLWDFDSRDWWTSYKPNKWVTSTLEAVHRNDCKVILLHDIHMSTAENLGQLLESLSIEGYSFIALEDNERESCRTGQVSQLPSPSGAAFHRS